MELLIINNEDIEISNLTEEETLCIKKYKGFYDCLAHIKVPAIKELIIYAINDSGSEDSLTDAVKVTKILIFLLKNDKILSDSVNSYFVDLLITSALLHNLTYKYCLSNWIDMFGAREIIQRINKDKDLGIPDNYISSICIPIESQLGKFMPNESLIPNPNTPGAHVALACSLHYKFLKQ